MALFPHVWVSHTLRSLPSSTLSRPTKMTAFPFRVRRALASLKERPEVTAPAQPTILPSDIPIEEELAPRYDPISVP